MAGDRNLLPVPQLATVIVRNDTVADFKAGQVVGLGAAATNPLVDAAHLAEFRTGPAFSGHTPAVPGRLGYFGVLLLDWPDGLRGPACVSGVCEAWLYVPADGRQSINYADIRRAATAS